MICFSKSANWPLGLPPPPPPLVTLQPTPAAPPPIVSITPAAVPALVPYVPMPGEADKGLALLGQSLRLDPDYPPAHATAAWCYERRYLRGGLHEADKKAALEHAQTAIAAGPDDAGTLATAGFVIGLVAHDYKTAMEVIDRALTLTGASAMALWNAWCISPRRC